MSQPAKILLVDDEDDILEFLSYSLEQEEYDLMTANNGKEAIEKAREFVPDLVVLDIMMPDMDGIEVCGKLKEIPELKNTLIAFLTARSESFTQVTALDSGGDDYINKPIKPNVLKSRIKALLRRHYKSQSDEQGSTMEFKGLTIDLEQLIVQVGKKEINLAKKEFELLCLLASKPGKVFKREVIMNQVWGTDVIVGDRTIDVHIRKLREKLGKKFIETYKGVGYKFSG